MTGTLPRRRLKLVSGLATLAGLAGFVVLIAVQGVSQLAHVLLSAGWGIALVIAVHFLPVLATALGWRAVAGAVWRGSVGVFLWARVLREAINGLLPVAQVGGDVVGARVLTFRGCRVNVAAASVLVDVTLEVVTQVAFTLLGVGLLLLVRQHGDVVEGAVIGVGVAIPIAIGLVLAQRWGAVAFVERQLERLALRFGWPGLGSLANLHETIMAMYRDRRAMAAATAWHFATWLLDVVETWVILSVLHADIGLLQVLIIESLGQAIRSAAFLVPGALGVQEGGYLLLGVSFGLSPQVALSVSLVKRIRELAIGVPAMLAWQVIEGRRLVGTGGDAGDTGPAGTEGR